MLHCLFKSDVIFLELNMNYLFNIILFINKLTIYNNMTLYL